MARGVNKVTLIGRLGKDPEFRTTGAGLGISTLSVATTETWRDQQGQKQEKTEWHRVVAFNKLAEIMRDYAKKGAQVYVFGKLETRKYTDQQGVERSVTQITATEIQLLDSVKNQQPQNSGWQTHDAQENYY